MFNEINVQLQLSSYKIILFESFTHKLAKNTTCDKISPRCAELNALNAT